MQHSPAGNIERLVEDMVATLPLYESLQAGGRGILPSPAFLGGLGQSYLDSLPDHEFAAEKFPGFERLANAWLWPTGVADVSLSLFLAGVIVARRDVWMGFQEGSGAGEIDWVRCLQWLVIHGIREVGLTRFIQPPFAAALRRESMAFGQAMISPLEWLIAREYGAGRWEQFLRDRDGMRALLQDWMSERPDDEMMVLFDGARQRTHRPEVSHTKVRTAKPRADRFRPSRGGPGGKLPPTL